MKQFARVCVALLVVAGLTGCISRDELNELKANQDLVHHLEPSSDLSNDGIVWNLKQDRGSKII